MPRKMPFSVTIRRLIRAVEEIKKAIDNQTDSIDAEHEQKGKEQHPPPKVRAEIRFPKEIEEKDEVYKEKQKSLTKWSITASWFTFSVVTVYAGIAAWQLCAMLDSNKISRDANIVAQRAFVFFPSVAQVNPVVDSVTKEKGLVFVFKLENSGNTPARVDGDYVNTNRPEWGRLPSDFAFADNPKSIGNFPNSTTEASKFPIAPHETWDTYKLIVPESVIQLVNTGKAHVYFWGWVSYTDVFGCSHRTEFVRQLVSVQLPAIFTELYSPERNCFDGNCKDYQPQQNPSCPN